jgi:hypothetical protein
MPMRRRISPRTRRLLTEPITREVPLQTMHARERIRTRLNLSIAIPAKIPAIEKLRLYVIPERSP